MNVYSEIASNKLKTYLILFFFFIFVSFTVYVIGKALGLEGYGLFVFAFLLSFVGSMVSYYFSDKIVLTLHGARPADRSKYFDFYTVTENLALGAGLPMPKLYVIDDSAPNAFATGRNYKHAVVVATTGLLSLMERRELEGVIAHELSHIKNYDILVMTIVSIMVGFIVYLTDFFSRSLWYRSADDRDNRGSAAIILLSVVIAILAPIMATILQLAISRKREFLADASAAYLTRYPEGLARALEKLAASNKVLRSASNATAHLFISSPLKTDKTSKVSWIAKLFSTHPPLEERISKLRAM